MRQDDEDSPKMNVIGRLIGNSHRYNAIIMLILHGMSGCMQPRCPHWARSRSVAAISCGAGRRGAQYRRAPPTANLNVALRRVES
jgi:hypothetical protein